MRTPGKKKPPPEPAPLPWCPELPDGLAFLRGVTWQPLSGAASHVKAGPWIETLQDRWVSAVAHVWSLAAVTRSARVLLDIGRRSEAEVQQAAHIGAVAETSRYPLTADLLGVCRPQPECWWHADPEGFVLVLDRLTGQLVPLRGVIVWADKAAQRLVLVAVDGTGEPWTGVVWPVGTTREQVLAQLATAPDAGPTTLALASVITMGVLGGLLAQLGGVVDTVELVTPEGAGVWSCLRDELPAVAPTERPS